MKIGIIGSDRKEWHIKRLLMELENQGAEAYLFPITKMKATIGNKPRLSVKGYPIDDYDAVIVRRVPGGTAEQVFYRMDTLHRLDEMGVRVFNPADSIEKAVDKYYTSALLEEAGIKTPTTIVTESFNEAMKAFKELGEDVIVKPLFGSLGMGITRVTSEDVAYRVFRALEMTKSVFYLQKYIPHKGEDIRVFVIGDEVVASMKRVSDNWKTNISAGAKAVKHQVSKEIQEICLKAARKLGLEYTGVDVIVSEDDIYVIELNSTPGWEGLQTVTEINITKKLVEHVLSKLG
ncbi:MAG: RimK family alpha-L-glutamate ligase [Candidatus Bathyarchaeota archaeon]|nr:RimK family alpha-L-glutamate ligase [Candidatus Bathyarchaeota archaeon]